METDDLIEFSNGQKPENNNNNDPKKATTTKMDDEFDDEDDEFDKESARTADEQMDYLESLEPCPCYAKCCIDSVITLFCVTLLG